MNVGSCFSGGKKQEKCDAHLYVLRFVERRLEVLSSIEDAENGHYIVCHFEGDAYAPSKAENAQTGTNVVSPRAPHGKGLQAFALLRDCACEAGSNLRDAAAAI